jgi:hypothetical protein
MTCPRVHFIEELRIHSIQLTHAEREIAVRRFNQKMIMVIHEAVGVANPIIALIDVLEGIQKIDAVLVAFEHGLPLITT